MGDGWTLEAQAIDAKAEPRQVWIVLKYNGNTLEDKVLQQGECYTYFDDNLGGESDVPTFVTYVDSVFAGATSDMVQLRYTWVTGRDVTEIDSGDEIGALEVTSTSGKTLELMNKDESIDLSVDTVETIAGAMKLRVADDDEVLRFYPFAERTIGVSDGEPTPTATPTETPTGNVTVPPEDNVTVPPEDNATVPHSEESHWMFF